MARTLEIKSSRNNFRLLLDGNEIECVLGYTLRQSAEEATTLDLTVCVIDEVTVEVEADVY